MSTSSNVFYALSVLFYSNDPEYYDKGQIDGANIALIWFGVIALVIVIIALMSHRPDITHKEPAVDLKIIHGHGLRCASTTAHVQN